MCKRLAIPFAVFISLGIVPTKARAQGEQLLSPPAKASCKFTDGKTIMVNYSSPRMRGRKIYGDLAPQGRMDQAVEECIVGRRVRAEQELALSAAAGDQVELARKHLAREHAPGDQQAACQCSVMRSPAVRGTSVRWPATASETRT